MDKARFVEIAPTYYSLALCEYYNSAEEIFISKESAQAYYRHSEENGDEYAYLDNDVLFDQAIDWLRRRGMLQVILDDFGPPIFRPSEHWSTGLTDLTNDQNSPFFKHAVSGRGRGWLLRALESVNAAFERLGVSEADFESPPTNWEPLPLDREDEQLQEAIANVDATIEQIRGDNGYSASLPEERKYVLESLKAVARALKEDASISVGYLRVFAFEPLATVMHRFKDAAIGVVATAASAALLEYLKQRGVSLLGQFFGR